MTDEDSRLNSLTGSVSDGRPVDWKRAESAAHDASEQARIQALRDVSRIADFSRGMQRAQPSPTGAGGTAAPPAERWGDLLLLEPIGTGAAGQVWRAWDSQLHREVALKFLLPRAGGGEEALPALVEEARALARVRHPNVAAVHGVAEHEGRAGLWMEYVHGPSLAAEIERRGALPADEVARVGRDLALALAAVHGAGIVHRDVKPANVVITPEGRAVLADFGLGLRPALAGPEPLRTSGTPMFMAPELLAGEGAAAWTDLYALGVTLWFALAGRPPFAARTIGELRGDAARGPQSRLSELRPEASNALVAVIERAMAPDPSARFSSAEAMAAALETASPRAPAHPGARAAGAPRRMARGWALAGAAGAIALALWLVPRWTGRPGGTESESRRQPATAEVAGPSQAARGTEATFVRRTGGAYQRLADGDRVAPGDRLSLEIRTPRREWVYVLNADDRGETFLLFPQPSFDVANPIAAESTQVLPGPIGGRENAWTVTSRGGHERFLVVASPAPVPEMEAELRRLPPVRPGRPIQYARVTEQTLEHMRGVGGFAPLPADSRGRGGSAFERLAALARRESAGGGWWVRQVTLANPL
jgi:hypothetical protein